MQDINAEILKKLGSYFSDIMHLVSCEPWKEALPHIKLNVIDDLDCPQTLSTVVTEYKTSRQDVYLSFRQAARRVWKEGGNSTSRVITDVFYTSVIPDMLFELTMFSVMIDVTNKKYAFCYAPVHAATAARLPGLPESPVYVVIDTYQTTSVGELDSLNKILPELPVFDFIDEFIECIKMQEEIDGHTD